MRPERLRQLNTTLAISLVAVFAAGAASGQAAVPASELAAKITAMVAEPSVSRAHWGVIVTALDGAPIFALNEGQLFQPASNTKLFTTAAALALLGEQKKFETRVVAAGQLSKEGVLNGNLELVGGGDANLSGRVIPFSPAKNRSQPAPDQLRYLAELADKLVASGLKIVEGDIVGDDSFFPYEPYAIDWATDDAVWGYGAPVSALSVVDNQLRLTVTPGSADAGSATWKTPAITIDGDASVYRLESSVRTVAPNSHTNIQIERSAGSRTLRVYGEIAANAEPDVEEIAIPDPAEYAATQLKEILTSRGITVTGQARAVHSPAMEPRSFLEQVREATSPHLRDASTHAGCADFGRPDIFAQKTILATHTSPPLSQDIVVTNKVSQNLHAELLLHHLGESQTCIGSTAQGARVVRSFLLSSGIDPDDFVFYDGSGLSGHDLVTPRAIAKLLHFASTQPWFATYKASLPIGGVDGSLESRFTKPPLKGHIFAKTGTLGEARALSGYLQCASGKTIIFSILAGNYIPGTSAQREVVDRIVAAIAAAN